MKSSILTYILILLSVTAFSQTVRFDTHLEGSPVSFNKQTDPEIIEPRNFSYLENLDFEQKIFWRKRYNNEGVEKDSYWFHSVYLTDSMVGIKLIGLDVNFMHEEFDTERWNYFRKWNCIRMGTAISIEMNPFEEHHAVEDYYKYINPSFYINYLHISKLTRGDMRTKYRRGAWGIKLYVDARKRAKMSLQIKPLDFVWVHFRFKHNIYDQKFYSVFVEWELNPNGYSNCKVENTRDLYKGLSVFTGLDYNYSNQSYMLNIGMHFSYRNH